MQSVLYILMYWTQTCQRRWQPHSSRTKPILSAAQCAVPPPVLSDRPEMSIRTAGMWIQMICFSASHWSQFPEANKPGNDFISGMGRALCRWNITSSHGGWRIYSLPSDRSIHMGRAHLRSSKCATRTRGAGYETSKPCDWTRGGVPRLQGRDEARTSTYQS